MDKLTAIRVFLNVVKLGSFSKASEKMGLSSTSSSRLVKELEDQLGAQLLRRSTRSMSLTEVGETLARHYQDMLNGLDEIEAEASSAAVEPSGRLRISLPSTFGTVVLAPILRDYRTSFPAVALEVCLGDHRVDLIKEGFDVAVRIARELDPALIARRLTTVQVMLCASPNYLARYGHPRVPADLEDHTCLLYSENTPPDEWQLIGPDGPMVQRVTGPVRANSGEILRQCALAGDGIIMQPTFIIGEDIRQGLLVKVLDGYEPIPRSAYAIYSARHHLPRTIRTFIDFLVGRIGDPPRWDEGLTPLERDMSNSTQQDFRDRQAEP